jgi:hypothetical protein
MKVEEERNDLLLNEESMTQLGFSEEVKEYVRERQNIFRKIRKEEEEIEELEKKYEMRRESSILHQLQEVNRHLYEIHTDHLNKLQDIWLNNIEVGKFTESIDKSLSDFKSETSHRVEDSIYFIKVFGTLISILLIILIIVTFTTS